MLQPMAGCSHTNAGPVGTFRSAHRRHGNVLGGIQTLPSAPNKWGRAIAQTLVIAESMPHESPRLLNCLSIGLSIDADGML
jgi:hypothetical protein